MISGSRQLLPIPHFKITIMYTLGQILSVLHWRKITYGLVRKTVGDHEEDCVTFVYQNLVVNISVFAGWREGFQAYNEQFDKLQISVDRATPILTILQCHWLSSPYAAFNILSICEAIRDGAVLLQPKPGRPKTKK